VGRDSLKMVQRGIMTATVILSLGGCHATNVETYNPIDNANKTMSVPADDTMLIGAIKQRLQRDGWRLTVEGEQPQTPGAPSPTRYSLTIRQSQTDTCYPKGGAEVIFKLVVMDNKTHDAVLTEDGRDCTDTAAAKFIVALRRAARR
jgi:hypothetical protein